MSGGNNMEKKEQLEKQIRRLKQIREDLRMNKISCIEEKNEV